MQHTRCDGPLWGVLLLSFFALGSLGCFGVAAATQAQQTTDAEILSTDLFSSSADL